MPTRESCYAWLAPSRVDTIVLTFRFVCTFRSNGPGYRQYWHIGWEAEDIFNGASRVCGDFTVPNHYCFYRSGKSSIQKVVLHKMAPAETLYLEITNKIERSGGFPICFSPYFLVLPPPPSSVPTCSYVHHLFCSFDLHRLLQYFPSWFTQKSPLPSRSPPLYFATSRLDVSDCSFIKFQVWDFPGHIDFCDPIFKSDEIFTGSCAIIFVIDAQVSACVVPKQNSIWVKLVFIHAKWLVAPLQDDYLAALQKLSLTIENVYKKNPNIKYEVFIHKVDGLMEDQMVEIQRDITQRVTNIIDDIIFTHVEGVSGDATSRSISIGHVYKFVPALCPNLLLLLILAILPLRSSLSTDFFVDHEIAIYLRAFFSPLIWHINYSSATTIYPQLCNWIYWAMPRACTC